MDAIRKHVVSAPDSEPQAKGRPALLYLDLLTDISASNVSTGIKVDTDKLALKIGTISTLVSPM